MHVLRALREEQEPQQAAAATPEPSPASPAELTPTQHQTRQPASRPAVPDLPAAPLSGSTSVKGGEACLLTLQDLMVAVAGALNGAAWLTALAAHATSTATAVPAAVAAVSTGSQTPQLPQNAPAPAAITSSVAKRLWSTVLSTHYYALAVCTEAAQGLALVLSAMADGDPDKLQPSFAESELEMACALVALGMQCVVAAQEVVQSAGSGAAAGNAAAGGSFGTAAAPAASGGLPAAQQPLRGPPRSLRSQVHVLRRAVGRFTASKDALLGALVPPAQQQAVVAAAAAGTAAGAGFLGGYEVAATAGLSVGGPLQQTPQQPEPLPDPAAAFVAHVGAVLATAIRRASATEADAHASMMAAAHVAATIHNAAASPTKFGAVLGAGAGTAAGTAATGPLVGSPVKHPHGRHGPADILGDPLDLLEDMLMGMPSGGESDSSDSESDMDEGPVQAQGSRHAAAATLPAVAVTQALGAGKTGKQQQARHEAHVLSPDACQARPAAKPPAPKRAPAPAAEQQPAKKACTKVAPRTSRAAAPAAAALAAAPGPCSPAASPTPRRLQLQPQPLSLSPSAAPQLPPGSRPSQPVPKKGSAGSCKPGASGPVADLSANPFVSACIREAGGARRAGLRGRGKANAACTAKGGKGKGGEVPKRRKHRAHDSDEESEEEGGWSDLEDFIVCQPGRDYRALLAARFRYNGESSDEEEEGRGAQAGGRKQKR